MNWADRLAQERRARLAAERMLDQKQRELLTAYEQLEIHARSLSDQIVEQRQVVNTALSEAEHVKSQHSRALRDLEAAHAAAVMAERRLWDSIDAFHDGFAVFDREMRLVGANRAFRTTFAGIGEDMAGVHYAQIINVLASQEMIDLDGAAPDVWAARILARHDQPEIPPEILKLTDGRWIKLIEQRAQDGDMVSLVLDITDTMAHQAEMAEARERAEAANRAKSAFLANMSHEIRTPLNGIVGMAEMLADSPLDDEQRLYLDTIRSSGDALLKIINDVLDFSKIEARRLTLRPEIFEPERCIREVVALLQPEAAHRDIALEVDIDLFLPTRFEVDPLRLRQILTNLAGNAVKFTETGHVRIAMTGFETETGGLWDLRVTVSDTGIGIAAEQQVHIFGEFNQIEDQSNRRFEGTGLGLAITQQLITLMGGDIWVDSTPGKGSTFGLSLKLPAAEPPQAELAPLNLSRVAVLDPRSSYRALLKREIESFGVAVTLCTEQEALFNALDAGPGIDAILLHLSEPTPARSTDPARQMPETEPAQDDTLAQVRAQGWDGPVIAIGTNLPDSEGYAAVLPPLPLRRALYQALCTAKPAPDGGAARPDAGRRPMRLLSAEDNRTNQLVLAKMLKDLDINLAFASNGHEAVEQFQRLRPDLILMDISMPGMDGREATRRIRALEDARRDASQSTREPVPIVALTAHAQEGDDGGCLDAGMDGFIPKPLRRKALVQTILSHAPAGVRPPLATDAHPDTKRPPDTPGSQRATPRSATAGVT